MHCRCIGDMVPLHATRSELGGGSKLRTGLSSSISRSGGWGRESKTQAEKLTALEAYRAGKLHLPPGYTLLYGADVLLLRRDDGSVVAAFSATGATPSEVARTAEEDYRANGMSSA